MASGQEGGDLQINLDNISKELMNIITATSEEYNALDLQCQEDNHCHQREFVRLFSTNFRSSLHNFRLQPDSIQFKRSSRIESINDDNLSGTSQEASHSDIVEEIVFDYPLNFPLADVRPDFYDMGNSALVSNQSDFNGLDYLPSSPLPSNQSNISPTFIVDYMPGFPLEENQSEFRNKFNFNHSVNHELPSGQPNNGVVSSCPMALRPPDFSGEHVFDNLPSTSLAANNQYVGMDALIDDNAQLGQRKLYSNKSSFCPVFRNYQLSNTNLAVRNSFDMVNNGICLQSEMAHSIIPEFESLNYKNLSTTTLAIGKPEFGAALPFNSHSITADPCNDNRSNVKAVKKQNMPIFEMHYLPSTQSKSNVKNSRKKFERNVQAENDKNLYDFKVQSNQKTLLHSSLKGAYRNINSTDHLIESTSNDNNCNNYGDYNNGKIIKDIDKFGSFSKWKEPNSILRLFALLKGIHHGINEITAMIKSENFNDEMIYAGAFCGSPQIDMPCTMSVQSQVKEASHLLHAFVYEMDAILKLNRKYDEKLSIEYENFLNVFRKLLEQFDEYKVKDLMHRFGQYTSENNKVRAEQLEKLLEKLSCQIRNVRTHFSTYDWFIKVVHGKAADNSSNVNEINKNIPEAGQPNASAANIINDILEIAEMEQYQGIVAFHERQRALQLFKAQQNIIKSNVWDFNYNCNDDDYTCNYNYKYYN